jgi:hypothetical protein
MDLFENVWIPIEQKEQGEATELKEERCGVCLGQFIANYAYLSFRIVIKYSFAYTCLTTIYLDYFFFVIVIKYDI